MPSIDIRYKHDKTVKEAKKAVSEVAAEIGKRFDLKHEWKGNVLHFERTGVTGTIALEKNLVHVTAELGFLLAFLKPAVEREIHKGLEQHFA
jgi:putative polyhydroxyalkanoate system protein